VTVNPTPTVASVSNQGPYCNGATGTAISFSSPEGGATFNWTSTGNVGFGLSGSGNMASCAETNRTTAPVVVTVSATPTANGCPCPTLFRSVTVNPTPTVASVSNQGPYCNGATGTAISFSSPEGGATFNWTSTGNVGFGLSGSGN